MIRSEKSRFLFWLLVQINISHVYYSHPVLPKRSYTSYRISQHQTNFIFYLNISVLLKVLLVIIDVGPLKWGHDPEASGRFIFFQKYDMYLDIKTCEKWSKYTHRDNIIMLILVFDMPNKFNLSSFILLFKKENRFQKVLSMYNSAVFVWSLDFYC